MKVCVEYYKWGLATALAVPLLPHYAIEHCRAWCVKTHPAIVNNNYIDEARPKNGLGKRIQEPNIRANVGKESEMADNRNTKHRCQI